MFDRINEGRYWDKPWTLVSGCTTCSPGCKHCWALAMEHRFQKTEAKGHGSRKVEIHRERLAIPLKQKKPTVWAIWNDLFHEDVPDSFLYQVFNTMVGERRHIFLVLTKRINGMAYFLNNSGVCVMDNVWLGVTVCNQEEADEKIPLLLQIPAAVRWVSIEPMLGPVDLSEWFGLYEYDEGKWSLTVGERWRDSPDWVVIGGESGPGARKMQYEWVKSVRDQCQAAGVPLFFKSWGEWALKGSTDIPSTAFGVLSPEGEWFGGHTGWNGRSIDPDTHEAYMVRVGKKVAGRLLDGREWNELPNLKEESCRDFSKV